jgi:tripartite-type tricarboxylate transporter receptor subunit TctC
MRSSRLSKWVLSLAALAAFAPLPALSQGDAAVASFYRGKTVRIVVGLGAGGSFDITARAVARHIGREIPGNPTVIVENVPGAGSMLALNQIYNTMPKDGTVIGNVSGPILSNQVFGNPAAKFDASRLRILGVPAPLVHMLVVTRASGVTRLEELIGPNAKPVKIGSTAPASAISNSANLAKDAVGLNYQIVHGYDGFAKIALAMDQGEVNATFNNIDELRGLYKEKVDSGDWRILAQSSEAQHPRAPKVPVLTELARDADTREALRLGAILPQRFGFLYFLAPGVPEDRARALENAFAKTMVDKAFIADMEKAKLVVDPISAADTQKMVSEFVNMPEKTKARLRPIMSPAAK